MIVKYQNLRQNRMCFEKKKKKAQVPRKQSPMEAKNGSVQSLLNSPHSECDKYTNHLQAILFHVEMAWLW